MLYKVTETMGFYAEELPEFAADTRADATHLARERLKGLSHKA